MRLTGVFLWLITFSSTSWTATFIVASAVIFKYGKMCKSVFYELVVLATRSNLQNCFMLLIYKLLVPETTVKWSSRSYEYSAIQISYNGDFALRFNSIASGCTPTYHGVVYLPNYVYYYVSIFDYVCLIFQPVVIYNWYWQQMSTRARILWL